MLTSLQAAGTTAAASTAVATPVGGTTASLLPTKAASSIFSSNSSTGGGATYIGPLICSDPSCPTPQDGWGRPINNSNFHVRDVSIADGGDGFYYLTGTSTFAGDPLWADVYGVVRMWRSRTLAPGSFEGGKVVFNMTHDCPWCPKKCVTPNSCRYWTTTGHDFRCGELRTSPAPAGCKTGYDTRCGGMIWAPEFHYLPRKASPEPHGCFWISSNISSMAVVINLA